LGFAIIQAFYALLSCILICIPIFVYQNDFFMSQREYAKIVYSDLDTNFFDNRSVGA
jgi:hypothetical protein